MVPPVYIIGLILIPVILLIGLLAWRFLERNNHKTPIIKKNGNYKALRTYRYKVSDFITPVDPTNEVGPDEAAGSILNELVSEEEYVRFKTEAKPAVDLREFDEELFPEIKNCPKQDTVEHNPKPLGSDETALEPGVRHSITTDGTPEIEQAEGPAQSLYHNPLTAPAPTDNDKKNREAEIALKRRRRAELKNSTSSAKAGFSELFSPDSPAKAPPINGTDS